MPFGLTRKKPEDLRDYWLRTQVPAAYQRSLEELLFGGPDPARARANVAAGGASSVTLFEQAAALLIGTSAVGGSYQLARAVGVDPALEGLLDVFDNMQAYTTSVLRAAAETQRDPAYEVRRAGSVVRVLAFDTIADLLAESQDPSAWLDDLDRYAHAGRSIASASPRSSRHTGSPAGSPTSGVRSSTRVLPALVGRPLRHRPGPKKGVPN